MMTKELPGSFIKLKRDVHDRSPIDEFDILLVTRVIQHTDSIYCTVHVIDRHGEDGIVIALPNFDHDDVWELARL